VVEPAAASLPFVALEAGAAVIEVNPAATPLSARATVVLAGAAGDVLPRLLG
jgi:NAD-dependent deacetylase